jgi:NAD dependent epimerase/dehydratase family enzyme
VVGLYNATSPHAVTNAELMTALRVVQGRSVAVPLPAIAVRMGSFLLRTEPELILSGGRGVPSRLVAEGFRFQFPELSGALRNLWRSRTAGDENLVASVSHCSEALRSNDRRGPGASRPPVA